MSCQYNMWIFLSALEDQMNVIKKHIDQYKEIGEANEHAISELTKVQIFFNLIQPVGLQDFKSVYVYPG